MAPNKEIAIINVAEEMIRQGGYNNFSFRNIAKAIGIKSSSVHYHFPTKEDLCVAVVRTYTDNFLQALGDPSELVAKGKSPVNRMVKSFRSALVENQSMCLCGMLGAETDALPERVIAENKKFFARNIEWLENALALSGLDKKQAHEKAIQSIALLEGAMIMSNAMADARVFDSAIKVLAQ